MLLPAVDEWLDAAVCEAGEVMEAEGSGSVLAVLGAGLGVTSSAVTAPGSTPVTLDNTSAVDGWDVLAKGVPEVLLVLLCCGLGGTAGDPSGEEEEDMEKEKEWLVVAELGGVEEAVPLSVPVLGTVVPVPAVGNAVLTVLLSADIPSALPSHIVGSVVLPSSSIIIIVEGDSQVVPRRELFVWVLGSGTEALELFAAAPVVVSLFVLPETLASLSEVAVVVFPPSNATTAPVRIPEMWIMDCCSVIL